MAEIRINEQGELKLFDSDSSNFIGLKSPGTVSSDASFILPSADGSANFVLKTDGSKNLSFVDASTLVNPSIDWQSSVKTATFSASAGEGYFVNTNAGSFTLNLPAGSVGAQVAFIDFDGSFDSNQLTVSANGSELIQGSSDDAFFSREREGVTLVYSGSTQGWLVASTADQAATQATYISASGGTETTSGNFKIHTFTSSGTFTVNSVGNGSRNVVDYLVVAGGGGGGSGTTPGGSEFEGGGGGAGGYRFTAGTSSGSYSTGAPTPLGATALTVSAQGYPITIGAGGSGATSHTVRGSNGNPSVFSSITSAGGGAGGSRDTPVQPGNAGGSGGGGGQKDSPSDNGGAGNSPPVSPPQGNDGGSGLVGGVPSSSGGGGGGGASAAGGDATVGSGAEGGNGAAGFSSSITASPVARGGGGGGAGTSSGAGFPGTGGGGRGAAPGNAATSGTANTGGGGGGNGGARPDPETGGSGGSGIVVIRYQFQT